MWLGTFPAKPDLCLYLKTLLLFVKGCRSHFFLFHSMGSDGSGDGKKAPPAVTPTPDATTTSATIARHYTTTSTTRGRVPTTRLYYEDSEWYTPPPEPKKTIEQEQSPKLPRGVTPKTTVVQAHVDLDDLHWKGEKYATSQSQPRNMDWKAF